MKRFNRLRTVFSLPKRFDAKTERQFLRDYSERFVAQRQMATVLAVCVSLIYFSFDVAVVLYTGKLGDTVITILALRLLGTLALSIAMELSFLPVAKSNERYASFCIGFSVLSAYFMLLALTYLTPFPTNYAYYTNSMLLVFLFLFSFSKLLAKQTLILTVFLLALTALTFNTENIVVLSDLEKMVCLDYDSPMKFLSIFAVIGCFISIEQERVARHTFVREQALQRAHQETESKTIELLALKEQARLQAEQQNRDKSKFIASAAHDLRNAMQPIGHFLEVSRTALSREEIDNARDYIKDTITASQAMRTTLNAILDISELESGIIQTHYSSFDTRLLVSELVQQNALLATTHQVTFCISKHRGVIVKSDRHHLQRVLLNLIANAIKYTDASKAKSTVFIGIVCTTQTVRIDVIDNGIGIAPNEQANVFKPLYQINNAERNRDNGIGLGLSIVNSTINLLTDHHIALRSTLGVGSRFTLRLPKSNAVAVAEIEPPMTTDYSLKGLYVLLVENDFLVKKSMIALLKANGAHYEAVNSVEELLTLLPTLERDPDVVVTDSRLSNDCSAVDVIEAVKTILGYERPILIMTGETADLSLEGKTIVQKPVEPKQLLTEINRLGRKQTVVSVSPYPAAPLR